VPFIVLGDGGSTAWKDMNTTLDNLIQQRRVPPMVSIQIGNGGQDAQGAQRGREYDTVSGAYAQFVEREVLPLVEQNAGVKLTKDPEGRATMGLSSSGTAAFTMAWFHPDSIIGCWPIRRPWSTSSGRGIPHYVAAPGNITVRGRVRPVPTSP
jgi:enterochelin esterase-like enzyme